MVGMFGARGERSRVAMPSARSGPPWISGAVTVSEAKAQSTRPATSSCIAGASPRKGTCSRSIPTCWRNSSIARCEVVTFPADP